MFSWTLLLQLQGGSSAWNSSFQCVVCFLSEGRLSSYLHNGYCPKVLTVDSVCKKLPPDWLPQVGHNLIRFGDRLFSFAPLVGLFYVSSALGVSNSFQGEMQQTQK